MAQSGSLANTIRTIYFYFFAGLGLVLLIVGIFQISNWGVKSFLLPKYDLNYDETRCDYVPLEVKVDSEQSNSEQNKKECLDRLEEQRKTKKITDLAQAITFILVGGIVFVFHIRRTSLLHR